MSARTHVRVLAERAVRIGLDKASPLTTLFPTEMNAPTP